jgi:hypothetical protein
MLDVEKLQRVEGEVRLLCESQGKCRYMAGELALLRQEDEQKGAKVETLQALLTEALLAKERFAKSNELLRDELARLKMKLTGHEGRERRENEMERRFPFLKAHLDYIREKCDHPNGDVLPFPGKSGNSSFDYRECCVLLSQVGEYQWQYLVKLAGFRPWRTIQRWRERKMEVIRLEASIFDGTEGSRRHLRELALANLRELPHEQRMEVAVACDAMAFNADVTVGPDGTVNGLSVPMHIDPALAAHQ